MLFGRNDSRRQVAHGTRLYEVEVGVNPVSRFFRKLSILFGRKRFNGELDEEMAFHRAQAEKEFVAAGMKPEAARYAAMRQLGNTTRLKEQSHGVVAFRAETVAQDVRFALRQMRKNPGFALTAILILALGMGVSVAIFGFVDAALLQPLPYASPDRLMDVAESGTAFPRSNLSRDDFDDWKRLNRSFTSLEVVWGHWLSVAHVFRRGSCAGSARKRWPLSHTGCEADAGAGLFSG